MPWSRGHEEIIFDALDRYDEALLGQRRGGPGAFQGLAPMAEASFLGMNWLWQ